MEFGLPRWIIAPEGVHVLSDPGVAPRMIHPGVFAKRAQWLDFGEPAELLVARLRQDLLVGGNVGQPLDVVQVHAVRVFLSFSGLGRQDLSDNVLMIS